MGIPDERDLLALPTAPPQQAFTSMNVLYFTKSEPIKLEETELDKDLIRLLKEQPNYGWILNPVLDILFACGGLLALVYLFIEVGDVIPGLSTGLLAATLWWVTKIGLIVFSWGHQPATLMRVYCSRLTGSTLVRITTLWGVLTLLMAFPLVTVPGFINVFLKLITIWLVQHVLAQAYGVALLYCYKRNYILNTFEKDTFHWMMRAGMLWLIVRTMVEKTYGSYPINGIMLPFWGPIPDWSMVVCHFLLAAALTACLFNIGKKYLRDKQMVPLPAFLTIFACLFTFLPTKHPEFSALVLAYYHGSQYLVVTSAFYLKERGIPLGMKTRELSKQLLKPHYICYFAAIVILGWIQADIIPRLCHNCLGISEAMAFGTMFCLLNFHHYFTDSLFWKMKDKKVRSLLIA